MGSEAGDDRARSVLRTVPLAAVLGSEWQMETGQTVRMRPTPK